MVSIKSKAEEALQKVHDLYQELDNERKQKEELSTIAGKSQELTSLLKEENAKQKLTLDLVVEE